MKKSILSASLSLLTSVCVASNPASTAYVDKQFAGIQAQIDVINASPGIAHPVGSCYGGGVVFFVNTTPGAPAGKQGLIAALEDAGGTGTSYDWDTNGDTGTVIAPLTAYFTGAENTANILTNIGATRAQAAFAATQTGDGYFDWYLPSQAELMAMWAQLDTSGASLWTLCGGTAPDTSDSFPNSYYWSSSQDDTNLAWAVSFGNGVVFNDSPNLPLVVRAVRAF